MCKVIFKSGEYFCTIKCFESTPIKIMFFRWKANLRKLMLLFELNHLSNCYYVFISLLTDSVSNFAVFEEDKTVSVLMYTKWTWVVQCVFDVELCRQSSQWLVSGEWKRKEFKSRSFWTYYYRFIEILFQSMLLFKSHNKARVWFLH